MKTKKYNNCPICGGKIKYRDDLKEYDSNDNLADIFECQKCKTVFTSSSNSDLLYSYFNRSCVTPTQGDFQDWDNYKIAIRKELAKCMSNILSDEF